MRAQSESPRLRFRDIIALAFASALFAALANTLAVYLQINVLGLASSATPDFAYLSPIGYLTVFAVVAVPLLALSKTIPARFGNVIIPMAFATLTAFALLLLVPRIHPLALLLIAIGIGAQLGSAYGRSPLTARVAVSRVGIGCAAAMTLIIAATVTLRALNAKALADSRGTPAEDAPNVILLILDTVRAKNVSVYGYARHTTPTLERLAARGVAFQHAFSTATFSAPSHSSMMTGLWGSQTGADYTYAMRRANGTVAEALNKRGYVSGAFMANAVWAGRNVGIARGFAHFVDFPLTFRQALWSTTLLQNRTGRRLVGGVVQRDLYRIKTAILKPDLLLLRHEISLDDRIQTPELVERFWRWRDGIGSHPYFAMMNFMDAHAPYRPPVRYRTMFGDSTREIDRYDGAIAYLDSVVGGIVDGLQRRGELERTIIVVTADHGELFGEHGIRGHTPSIYSRATWVPLIITGGPVPFRIRVQPEVSLRDLAATILDLTGVTDHTLPGSSLRSAWETGSNRMVSPVVMEAPKGKNVAQEDLTSVGAIVGAVDSAWYYIRYGDSREELFRRTDSLEVFNAVGTPEGREAANRLLEVIRNELRNRLPASAVARGEERSSVAPGGREAK